ncbi:MAG: hypothetical protein H6728_12645 [Myxococcales bacterium]|nr:hypothetical protein [Myxococcales bacterium]MCB9643916.1 hypothetical protein [Myxococcales bacterium]
MKMRIRDNTIRFRLNQPEVQSFSQEGYVETKISFGPSADQQLRYAIVRDQQATEVFADYQDNTVTVHVPPQIAQQWTETDQVGFETPKDPDEKQIYILVEKDFQCLKPREGQEDANAFPHPLALQEDASC